MAAYPGATTNRERGTTFLLAAIAATLLLAAVPRTALADFDKCSIESFMSGTVTSPTSVRIGSSSIGNLAFKCTGAPATGTPALTGGLGQVAIGNPSNPQGSDVWVFSITSQSFGGITELTFAEPGGSPTQRISLTIDAPPPSDPIPGGGSSGPGGGSSAPGCKTEPVVARAGSGEATRAQLLAREPGQASFSEVPVSKLCARIYSPADATLTLKQVSASVATTADGPWPFPKETVFRIVANTEGFEPSVGGGGIREPSLKVSSDGFTLQGKALWEPKLTSGCVKGRTAGFLSVAITESNTGDPDLMKGSIGGSNAYQTTGPNLKFPGATALRNGTMSYDLLGCGDGDPSTIDGFLDSFLSATFLQSLGMNQKLVEMADPAAISALMAANDNGKKVTATYKRERDLADSSWGVRMLYQTSFSPHKVAVGSNPRAVAFAKKCSTKKKAKLTASGKGSKRTLFCKPKAGKSSKLRVG